MTEQRWDELEQNFWIDKLEDVPYCWEGALAEYCTEGGGGAEQLTEGACALQLGVGAE